MCDILDVKRAGDSQDWTANSNALKWILHIGEERTETSEPLKKFSHEKFDTKKGISLQIKEEIRLR